MFESAVIEEIGNEYIVACYSAEGDSPLILTGNDIFGKLENKIFGVTSTNRIEEVLEEVLGLFESEILIIRNDWDVVKNKLAGFQNKMVELKKTLRNETTTTPATGRQIEYWIKRRSEVSNPKSVNLEST